MPGPMRGKGGNPNDKAKDFKGAMSRLFLELKKYRILIIIALILAMLGAVMSIIAPNKLSELADEIQKGLVINTENMQELAQQIMKPDAEEFEIDGMPFVGVIDYLGESDGEYHIIDNKSRALKPRSGRLVPTKKDEELDKMLVQLYIYAAAVKYKYGEFPKTLCFNCFRTGVFIEEPFVLEKYYDAINWVKDNIETIKQASDFSPWLDFFACTYICGYSNECCYWQERGRI